MGGRLEEEAGEAGERERERERKARRARPAGGL